MPSCAFAHVLTYHIICHLKERRSDPQGFPFQNCTFWNLRKSSQVRKQCMGWYFKFMYSGMDKQWVQLHTHTVQRTWAPIVFIEFAPIIIIVCGFNFTFKKIEEWSQKWTQNQHGTREREEEDDRHLTDGQLDGGWEWSNEGGGTTTAKTTTKFDLDVMEAHR